MLELLLKVLVVAPCYYPAVSYGGPVAAIHQMNKALVKNGVEVTVYTTNANGLQTLDVPTGKDVDVDAGMTNASPARRFDVTLDATGESIAERFQVAGGASENVDQPGLSGLAC